jgi:type IV pilus biogenesis protein CpaD/CtpE
MRILIILALLLAGCASTLPNVPETVYVTVQEFKPLPAWATAPVSVTKPIRQGDTVRAHLSHEDALDGAYDRLLGEINCRIRLLVKLDDGEAVSPDDCKP